MKQNYLQQFLDENLAIMVQTREEYDDFLDTLILNNIRGKSFELWKQFHNYNDCPEYTYLKNNMISCTVDADRLKVPFVHYSELMKEINGVKAADNKNNNVRIYPAEMTVAELAEKMDIPVAQLIKDFFLDADFVTAQTVLTQDKIRNILTKYDQELEENQEPAKSEPTFAEKYYDAVDEKHRDILEQCAVPCYSNKKGFTNLTRIEAIRGLLKKSGYKEIFLNTVSIWHKGDLAKQAEKDCILVSSHCDLVKNITKPYSSLDENGYYRGTYDNIGTNAAAIITMLEGDLPSNVMFAFTSDEETGRCQGAKDAVSFLKSMNIKKLTCMALDVTYEGYDEGMLASVENGTKDADFLKKIAKSALATEADRQTFCFVRKTRKAFPENLPKEYICKDTGLYDEAMAYGEIGQKSFSLCLPCDGEMHSNSGVKVRQPVFEGYVNTLKGMLYSLTKTHVNQLTAIQIEKNTLLDRTTELLEQEKAKRKSYSRSYEYDPEYYQYEMSDYFDEDAYDEIVEGTVIENIEAYSLSEREMFIRDCISMIDPNIYEIYHTLYAKIAQQWDDYQSYSNGTYEDDFGNPSAEEGYIDPEDFLID